MGVGFRLMGDLGSSIGITVTEESRPEYDKGPSSSTGKLTPEHQGDEMIRNALPACLQALLRTSQSEPPFKANPPTPFFEFFHVP